MKNPENDIFISDNKELLVQTNMMKDLSENFNEKRMLRKLLEQYFHMVDNLENLDLLEKNVSLYEDALKNLLAFSKTPFMEETTWRVSDNGKFEEYCWEHLRNLLSPFKNTITLIKNFSEWKIENDIFYRYYENNIKKTIMENKKNMLDFCDFLERKNN